VCAYLGLSVERIRYLRLHLARQRQPERDSVELSPELRVPLPGQHYGDLANRWAHRLDQWYQDLTGRPSRFPAWHFRFGVRPVISAKRCTLCGECLRACPVRALTLGPAKKIVLQASRCAPLRCLKCVAPAPRAPSRPGRTGVHSGG